MANQAPVSGVCLTICPRISGSRPPTVPPSSPLVFFSQGSEACQAPLAPSHSRSACDLLRVRCCRRNASLGFPEAVQRQVGRQKDEQTNRRGAGTERKGTRGDSSTPLLVGVDLLIGTGKRYQLLLAFRRPDDVGSSFLGAMSSSGPKSYHCCCRFFETVQILQKAGVELDQVHVERGGKSAARKGVHPVGLVSMPRNSLSQQPKTENTLILLTLLFRHHSAPHAQPKRRPSSSPCQPPPPPPPPPPPWPRPAGRFAQLHSRN